MKFLLSEILPAISLVLDYQEKGNLYHAWRVAIISRHLAESAASPLEGIIFYAALLHDIGAFGFGEHLINYTDLAVQKSVPWIKRHPVIGAEIVREIPGMSEGVNFILEHHERYDGTGYPRGKKKERILLGAQIIRIADSIDILLRHRPKPKIEDIRQYCRQEKGREIAGGLMEAFLGAYAGDDGRLLSEIDEDIKVAPVFKEMVGSISAPQVELKGDELEIILKIFSRIIDGKHHYTHQHSERTANYTQRIAKVMGLKEEEIRKIKFAGYLHDLGKIAIPNSILDKPGPLSEDEWQVIKKHASISGELANSVPSLKDLAPLVVAAQERWDGLGYPAGLKGEEASLGARIIAVADAIDAMLSDRAYRKALSVDKAKEELRMNSGIQFDPEVVEAALVLLKKRI